ncbi:MAG: DUF6448 family protein [Myxococcales bacterium]
MLRITVVVAATLMATAGQASAHCDTADGPVAVAVAQSLGTGDLAFTRVWIKDGADEELAAAFKKAMSVRKLSTEARELADESFLATAIRLHRAGEGEPFTGIKPKGTDPGPAVRAADQAIAIGSLAPVEKLLGPEHWAALEAKFKPLAGKPVPPKDVVQGRRWVEAYVVFVHAVDGAWRGGTKGCGHGKEPHAEPK